MRYHLKERAFHLTETFLVRDDSGRAVMEVRGKFFHVGDDLLIYDTATHQEIGRIKQHIISFLPSYDIYRNGERWANVHEQIHLFGEKFKIKGANGEVFHIQGNVWNWDFTISNQQGDLLASVNRRLSVFRDSYAIDVVSGVDVPFVIALAIVIEMVKIHHEEHEHDEG